MKQDLSKITCIEDLRQVAQRKVPKMFYDYVDSGSWTESTYHENHQDFQKIKLRQRVLVNMEERSLATKMLGQDVKMPLALAPTGFTGMMCADGEILAARAAEKFGVPFTLSTMSICSIEDVAMNTASPFWFQLYVLRDHVFMTNLIERAKAAQCSALVLTADLQILGQRHKDIKNNLSASIRPNMKHILQMMMKPEWGLRMLNTERRTFGNIVGHAYNVHDMNSLMQWTSEQFDLSLDWDDVKRIKDLWGGKLILKGILDPEDAEKAVQSGVDAIVVSNHGGRQLDGAISTIRALPDIVSAVGRQTEVWLDGGILSGQDMLKAWALGARGMMSGRAFLYGLGAFGEEGVTRALDILYKEMDITMALTGHRRLQDVTRDILVKGTYPVAESERHETLPQQQKRIYEQLYGWPRASLRFGTMW